jgi:hypothetical protein
VTDIPRAPRRARTTSGAGRVALAALAVLAALAACSDFEAPDDPTFGLPDVAVAEPTLARDVQPIFTARCSLGGCHSLAIRRAGLVLTPDSAYAMIVERVATERPDLRRVRLGKPDSSWLYIRIQPDQAPRGNLPRMPLASHPLTPNQIATIANWIARGAPRE